MASGTARRPRAGILIAAAAAVVVAAVGFAWYGVDLRSSSAEGGGGRLGPPATAVVTRQTLAETLKVSGTLGYSDAVTIAGRGTGTITWLPAAGAVVNRGQPVYRRDDVPIPLLYGALPAYRVLTSGIEGTDVHQFEENLAALRYSGFTVDDSYTSSTADAVRQWQADLGASQTGRVQPADIVIAAGAVRVATLQSTVGAPATGPVLTITDTTRVVSLRLDVSKQHLVTVGVSAEIALPDHSTVSGKVSEVGTVATSSPSGGAGGGAGGGSSVTTINVTIAVADQQKLGSLDAAPVTVTLQADRAENVLTVPIAALVALAEGGYGVQVIDGESSHYVAVNVGMFAGGRVEISGAGIAEGTTVGMPS